MNPRVSCVISAYNEEARIGEVLKVLSAHPDVDEIIVVDDGSTDRTANIVARFPAVRLIRFATNIGKSQALVEGIKASQHDLLLFIDADLVGMNAENVRALVEPVKSGRADMTMSLRKNSLLVYRMIGCDFVSGERVFSKTLIDGHYDAIAKLPPFGFEVYINRLALEENLRVKVVPWLNVVNPSKSAKRGLLSGLRSDVRMIKDIFHVITPLELLEQNYFLMGLR